MRRAANLPETSRDSSLSLQVHFEDVIFPPDTQFYQGHEIDAAYLPTTAQAYILRAPNLRPD